MSQYPGETHPATVSPIDSKRAPASPRKRRNPWPQRAVIALVLLRAN